MNVIQILVEGASDVLFLRQLLSSMEHALIGRWKECVPLNRRQSGLNAQFRSSTLTYKAEWNGSLLLLHATGGVRNIFPMPDPALEIVSYDVGEPGIVKVSKNVFIVDADFQSKVEGTGGNQAAQEKIAEVVRKCVAKGIMCAGFAMPTNQTDGTLEHLLEGMVPEAKRGVIDGCWARFKDCVKANGAKYEPSLKTMLDVYAKLFNARVQGRPFIGDSYSDKDLWNWDAPILVPLKSFLRTEVLCQHD